MPDTYRIYLRWPGQRVSNKTVTPDREVAEHALNRLCYDYCGQDVAAVMTCNGKQLSYLELTDCEQ